MHETLIEMFRYRPALATELLTDQFKVDLPPYQSIRLSSSNLNNLAPTEYRADEVLVLARGDTPALAVVVEVQLGPAKEKGWSWPVYLATLRARLKCPAVLLVICISSGVATSSAAEIDMGHPGWVLKPLVMGPRQVPVITDVGQAVRSPELAALSALAHATHPDRDQIFGALFAALDSIDTEHATLYHDVVLAELPAAVRRHLEALMSTGLREYRSEFARKYVGQGLAQGRAEGKAEGKAEALLAVLAARKVDVPEEARERITGCTDSDQLNTWIRRAVTADKITDLFD